MKKMAKGGRIFAGIFAIIGAAIIFIMAWVFWLLNFLLSIFGLGATWIILATLIACGVLGLVGGILLLVDKRAGGVLAIIGGAFDLVLTIIMVVLIVEAGSFLMATVIFLFIPPAILLTGGIVGTAVGNEFDG